MIDELAVLKAKEWLTALLCSNKRKNNILIPLCQLYDEMYHAEIIDKNPLTWVKNLSLQTREPQFFIPDEVANILSELAEQEKNLEIFAWSSGVWNQTLQ